MAADELQPLAAAFEVDSESPHKKQADAITKFATNAVKEKDTLFTGLMDHEINFTTTLLQEEQDRLTEIGRGGPGGQSWKELEGNKITHSTAFTTIQNFIKAGHCKMGGQEFEDELRAQIDASKNAKTKYERACLRWGETPVADYLDGVTDIVKKAELTRIESLVIRTLTGKNPAKEKEKTIMAKEIESMPSLGTKAKDIPKKLLQEAQSLILTG